MINETLVEALNELVSKRKERQAECEVAGQHKEVFWQPYAATSRSIASIDKVYGRCTYCGTLLKRNLNGEEIDSINQMYKHRREIVNI